MRIVGVGQIFNFQTGAVEDRIQIVTRIGTQFSVTTTNEGAALLVKMSLATGQRPLVEEEESVRSLYGGQGVAPPQSNEGHGDQDWDESQPDVFGGDTEEPSEEQVAMFQHTVETKAQRQSTASLGIRKNPPDRSGVPSRGISRVDERGNPILPEAPEVLDEDDDEDDPGEQI